MNENRRTMSAAILSPEALDFIKEGSPKPQSQTAVPQVVVDSAKAQAVVLPRKVEEIQRSAKPRPEKERGDVAVNLVSATFRLPSDIPMTLLRVASERKIKRISPHSQQDIVAEALKQWFEKNG